MFTRPAASGLYAVGCSSVCLFIYRLQLMAVAYRVDYSGRTSRCIETPQLPQWPKLSKAWTTKMKRSSYNAAYNQNRLMLFALTRHANTRELSRGSYLSGPCPFHQTHLPASSPPAIPLIHFPFSLPSLSLSFFCPIPSQVRLGSIEVL